MRNQYTATDVKLAREAYSKALSSGKFSVEALQNLLDDYIVKFTAFWRGKI